MFYFLKIIFNMLPNRFSTYDFFIKKENCTLQIWKKKKTVFIEGSGGQNGQRILLWPRGRNPKDVTAHLLHVALRLPSDEWIVNFFLRVFFYLALGIRSGSSFKLLLLAVTVFTPSKHVWWSSFSKLTWLRKK